MPGPLARPPLPPRRRASQGDELSVATTRTFLDQLLDKVHSELDSPGSYGYMRLGRAAFLAKYLAEQTLLEDSFASYHPLMVATCAIRLSHLTVDRQLARHIDEPLLRCTGYAKSQCAPHQPTCRRRHASPRPLGGPLALRSGWPPCSR
jgi:hypothetical protein